MSRRPCSVGRARAKQPRAGRHDEALHGAQPFEAALGGHHPRQERARGARRRASASDRLGAGCDSGRLARPDAATQRQPARRRSRRGGVARAPLAPPGPAEVGRHQVEIRHVDHFDVVEPEAAQLRRRTPPRCPPGRSTGGPAAGSSRATRSMSSVRDRIHPLAERLQLLDGQAVEQHVQHLRGDRVRRLDRQREAACDVRLRSGQLPLATRSRCSRQNSSTMRRSTSPVASDRVLVDASKSPASRSVSMSALAP